MAKISLICEQCGGNILLDNTNEVGICESCYARVIIKEDKIVQHITQNVTKHVYGIEGKDVEELIQDGYRLIDLGDFAKANAKFRKAVNIDPGCWWAWLGYAATGGGRDSYLAEVPAYRKAYALAEGEQQETETFANMACHFSDRSLRAVFIRAFNAAPKGERNEIFRLVSGVIGCDDSEIASLAIDLCPEDWRAHFAMAKFRQIRARWCKLEGGFFSPKHLPQHAEEVLRIFVRAYTLAKKEGPKATATVRSYVEELQRDGSYKDFAQELMKAIQREG